VSRDEETPPPALAGRRCLVTGGAGFIGSNVVRRLLAAGARVTVLDDLSVGRREHLPDDPALELVVADLVTWGGLRDLVAGADVVFHLAAQVGNVKSIAAAERDATVNVGGTVRLLDACRGTTVQRLVYSSSSAIFGEALSLPIDESHAVAPASFYALSKLTGERYAVLAHQLWGVPSVCLRYFNVYGLPLEDSEYSGVISIFLRRLLGGRPLWIYGDGQALRDFVHVEDVAAANLLAATAAAPGGIYNIGTGVGTTIGELAVTLAEVAGVEAEVEHHPPRAGEVRRSVANIARARTALGYAPAWSLRAGLAALWAWSSEAGAGARREAVPAPGRGGG
jgi:UDP-glucose 4-epimerase